MNDKHAILEAIKNVASSQTDFEIGFDNLFQFLAKYPNSETTQSFISWWLEQPEYGDDGWPSFTSLINQKFELLEWVAKKDIKQFTIETAQKK